MKRYRVISYGFDTSASILSAEVKSSWRPEIKENWHANKSSIRDGLISKFGAVQHERKIADFIELGNNPMSLVSFHNIFLDQVRNAFVAGSYYPALVGACTLGERMLNRLIIHLRKYYKNTPQYKKVFKKKSFDNWELAICTLVAWEILSPAPARDFRALEKLRHRSIHFNPETDTNSREIALKAITIIQRIVGSQFSALSKQPWYIPGGRGASYIAKNMEKHPFVIEFVLSNCALVGPNHKLDYSLGRWKVLDGDDYEDKEITDKEFISMLPK